MCAVLRLLEAVLRASGDDLHLVLDVVEEDVAEVQRARHAVDERHRVDRERGLHRGALVEVVQDHQAGRAPLERDDDAGVVARRLLVGVGDPVDLLGGHQLLDLGQHRVRPHLVRQLGDHDLVAAARRLLDLGDGPHPDGAAARAVGVHDPGAAHDERARGEVGALDVLHEVVGGGLGVVDEVHRGIDDLTQVVGRDVGGHAHRDALAAVHQQVGEATGQHRRFDELTG